MKKLLSILLLFVTFGALAQTYDTLPTGSKPYGNFYLGPDGNLVFGNAGLKFRVIGTKKRVDSLLALKADLSQLALYQTKALLQQDLSPSSTGYPSVDAVIGGLNTKANSGDLAAYQAKSEKGQSNGYAGLDGSEKVPLTQINDALLGAVNYRGTYNAATNSPTLPAAANSNKGYYYIVSTAGTQFGLEFRVGDWIISNGSSYGKVASSSDVESINGKKGVVNINLNDVLTAGNVSEQAMSVGAIATGSASVTSAPTQPSHVVRLDDISTGKMIGANAASATNWGGYPADFSSALNPQPDFGIGFKNGKAYTIDRPAFRQWVGINDGSLISNSIVGNAASATVWNGQTYLNTLRETPFSFMVNNSGTWGYTGTSQVKAALATSLQDVTNVNNATTLPIRTNGYSASNDFGSNFHIGLATGLGNKGVNIGYSPSIEAGFIGVVENATTWRNLVLQPFAGNVGIGATNPTERLDVNGNIRSRAEISAYNNAQTTFAYINGGVGTEVPRIGAWKIGVGHADLAISADGGNVGVGTITPTEKLTIAGGKLALTAVDATIGGKIYGYVDGAVYPYAGGLKLQTRTFTGSTYEYLDRLTINAFGTMTLAGSAQIDNDLTIGYSGQTNSIGSREVGQVLNLRGSGSLNIQTYDTDWRTRLSVANNGDIALGSSLTSAIVNGTLKVGGKIEPLNTANTLYINQPNSAQKVIIQNAGISRLEVGQTGITLPHLIGTTESLAVVNADGSLSRSTSGSIANGVYNPTMSNVTNTTATPTINPFTYMRVGNTVTVYGFVSLTKSEPTQNTNVSFSLPIASNFTDAIDAMGYGVSASTISSGATVSVSANPTLDIVNVNIGAVPSSAYNSNGYNFSFQYRIK
ncbi:beta strand repeat-containing protein [Pedobacter agri]|uniref:Uncharacterized protein n=1 Tax=Pedobacter agri TaxID=454586 RepID=A0A9X3I8H2_9SPHI|nr:hypothetical protein [Pedobacter agri]MCX3264822.1 hypothetical protein [Pedobacter agri]